MALSFDTSPPYADFVYPLYFDGTANFQVRLTFDDIPAPAAIEYSIYDAINTDNQIQGWELVPGGVPGGSPVTFTVTVNAATVSNKAMILSVRYEGQGGTQIKETVQFRVGMRIVVAGQSNAARQLTVGNFVVPEGMLYMTSGNQLRRPGNNGTGVGDLGFAEAVIARWNCSVLMMNNGEGGTDSCWESANGPGHWSNPAAGSRTRLLAKVDQGTDGDRLVHGIVWSQGGNEAITDVKEIEFIKWYYDLANHDLIRQLRTTYMNPDRALNPTSAHVYPTPFIGEVLNRMYNPNNNGSDEGTQTIRRAQLALYNTNAEAVYQVNTFDFHNEDEGDSANHWAEETRPEAGRRWAGLFSLDREIAQGTKTPADDPTPVLRGITANDTKTELTFHFSRNLVDPGQNYTTTDCRIMNNGNPVTVSSLVWSSPNKVVATLASPITGTLKVQYPYGQGTLATDPNLVFPKSELYTVAAGHTCNYMMSAIDSEFVELL